MKRVCAYCRVSTEQDDQLNSLDNQKRYFEKYIENNIAWEFCGLYVDEGISGTSVEKRASFQRMVADAEARKFDLLLTKEISRFARNTLDSIFYTRKLKGLGVGVLFMNDNINTLDADSELRLTIMSSIAQEESRKTSERVRWGQKRQMEKGVVFGASLLGYTAKNGKLTVNENEAKTVRLIFELYLSGMGAYLVQKELENRGIPAPNGGLRWHTSAILDILKNEKYAGMLKQKKTLTTDYLSHKRKPNEGEEDYIVVENSHEPIVTKEIFDRVQGEIKRRRSAVVEKSRYSNRYVWSGKIECAHCKSKFERKYSNQRAAPFEVVWRCAKAAKYGKEKINAQGRRVGCNCETVHEAFLRENFLAVVNSVIENKDMVVAELRSAMRRAIDNSPNKSAELEQVRADIDRVVARKLKLLDTHFDGVITRAEFEAANNRYNQQLAVLNKRFSALELDNETVVTLQQKLENVEAAIENLARLKEFGDSVCSEVLDKVVVEGREKMSFYLKTDKNATMFVKIPVLLSQSQHILRTAHLWMVCRHIDKKKAAVQTKKQKTNPCKNCLI
ncbi:MAG: recombinase family protein [Nitrososphaerota archaeon]|jgi:DNA invertase Pin-like site-specific DNA recombinase|nr:recombinase family protein [Nitrososphaerota archaeon]